MVFTQARGRRTCLIAYTEDGVSFLRYPLMVNLSKGFAQDRISFLGHPTVGNPAKNGSKWVLNIFKSQRDSGQSKVIRFLLIHASFPVC